MISYKPLWKTMEKKGITKYQLSTKFGFSRATVQRIVTGNLVTLYTIDRLCKVLDCGINDIVAYKEDE